VCKISLSSIRYTVASETYSSGEEALSKVIERATQA